MNIFSARTPAKPVGISGWGLYLPHRSLSNDDLVALGCPISADEIGLKTGVLNRHVADENDALSDLAARAAFGALKDAQRTIDEIDTIIVAGDNLDYGGVQLTSARVAQLLGRREVGCFDLKVGCPASPLAMHAGMALVASGLADRVLIVAAEVNTRPIDYTKVDASFFGDGAAAALLEPCAPDTGILAGLIGGTGDGAEILSIPAGGSREPLTCDGLAAGRNLLQMNGRAVFRFGVERFVKTLRELTSFLHLTPEDLDRVVPHQANGRITEAAMKQIGLPYERALSTIDRFGNTAGASLLMALADAIGSGVLRPGDLVGTTGFGGGLAWGGHIIRLNRPSDFLTSAKEYNP